MKKAPQANFPEFEAQMLSVWGQEKTFQKSLDARRSGKRFSFYDGPPFANGLPHYGHVVALTEKDVITRYKTMQGYYVPRRNGWDTHGLPVEFEVEKALGISGKRQILEMGVDKFNEAAKASVFKYKNEWEDFMVRLGRWSDQENSYATLDDNYIESVWNVLAQLYKKDLVYKGFRSNPYCPRCATPLSNFEVNQNYKDNVPDPSVYVKFQLADHEDTSFLAWTTTPWTLPANAALAVAADAEYVKVELLDDGDSWSKGEKLILAKQRLEVLDLKEVEYKVLATMKGSELAGGSYRPLYESQLSEAEQQTAYHIYIDESVSLEDGTGILHVAPRYGETDLAMGQREQLPLIESVDGNGVVTAGPEEAVGAFFKEADSHIIADLTRKGRIFAAETFEHTYPFCWRCETPLMYFAMPSWFVAVSTLRDKLVKNNEQITWVPAHIREGRFGNWLAEARDWNISRNRFWGAPIPIWVNEEDESDLIVVGSLDELRELSGGKDFDLHRPGIDQVTIKKDGKTYRRTEEVFDCWFESGGMPYAQDHYPFEGKEDFDQAFPADFIAEGLDQTRGWFYTLHVLATALFDKPAFKNVVVNGLVLAADGKKLSKRLRNYPDPQELFDKYGADSLRFFLMSSPVVAGEDVRFSADAVGEVYRNVFMTLWNVYSFFSTYAEVDNWQPNTEFTRPSSTNVLDQWLLARLDEVVAEMTLAADQYRLAKAAEPLRRLVDDLSNWYVRRSRRRFWKSDSDSDKAQAYLTLHYVLLRISQLLAPFAPFVSDTLWRGLTEGMNVAESVHLSDWPEVTKTDSDVLQQMELARQAVTMALSDRAAASIKVRQPLGELKVLAPVELSSDFVAVIAEEVNVKEVTQERSDQLAVVLNKEITQDLADEGAIRDLIRHIQSKRKETGLQVDDRIKLSLGLDSTALQRAIDTHMELIKSETLATELIVGEASDVVPVKVNQDSVTIDIARA